MGFEWQPKKLQSRRLRLRENSDSLFTLGASRVTRCVSAFGRFRKGKRARTRERRRGEVPTVTSQLDSHEKQKHESAIDKLFSTHKLSEIFKISQEGGLWLVHLSIEHHDIKMQVFTS